MQLGAVPAGRSAGRHRGVHQGEQRVHGQYRVDGEQRMCGGGGLRPLFRENVRSLARRGSLPEGACEADARFGLFLPARGGGTAAAAARGGPSRGFPRGRVALAPDPRDGRTYPDATAGPSRPEDRGAGQLL